MICVVVDFKVIKYFKSSKTLRDCIKKLGENLEMLFLENESVLIKYSWNTLFVSFMIFVVVVFKVPKYFLSPKLLNFELHSLERILKCNFM